LLDRFHIYVHISSSSSFFLRQVLSSIRTNDELLMLYTEFKEGTPIGSEKRRAEAEIGVGRGATSRAKSRTRGEAVIAAEL